MAKKQQPIERKFCSVSFILPHRKQAGASVDHQNVFDRFPFESWNGAVITRIAHRHQHHQFLILRSIQEQSNGRAAIQRSGYLRTKTEIKCQIEMKWSTAKFCWRSTYTKWHMVRRKRRIKKQEKQREEQDNANKKINIWMNVCYVCIASQNNCRDDSAICILCSIYAVCTVCECNTPKMNENVY